jgi:HK97 family phage prohead protease
MNKNQNKLKLKLHLDVPQQRNMTLMTDKDAQIKADEPTLFKGEAIVFERWSNDLGGFKEIIHKGAWSAKTKYTRAIATFNHKEENLLGTYKAGTLRFDVQPEFVHVEIDKCDTEISRSCSEWVRRGDIDGLSFMFFLEESDLLYNDEEGIYEHHIYEFKEVTDFSLVVRQSYNATNVALSRGMDLNAMQELFKAKEMETEAYIERANKDREMLDRILRKGK